jgi:hypothetical protein
MPTTAPGSQPAIEPRTVGPLPLTADQLLRSQETTLARLVTTGAIADSRSGLVISSNIGMLGALVASISGTTLHTASAWVWLLLALTAVACVASIAMAALAAFPRPGTRPGSLVFFGSIAEMPHDAYFERLRAVPQAEFARDLADQCHRVAVLAAMKFRWVRRAMATMMAAALPWLACLEMVGRLRLP